jgi:hypothetical protein
MKQGVKMLDKGCYFTLGLEFVKSGINDITRVFNIAAEYGSVFTETARGFGMTKQVIDTTQKNSIQK